MKEFHIKNYDEYIRILKRTFSDIERMPSILEIKFFLFKYNLNTDWEISVSEVGEDINSHIFYGKKKSVLSYKEYLDVLRIEFGIPQKIPTKEEIEIFISKYNLKDEWGITEKEILKDFESVIAGRYDDMYKDAIQDVRKTVRKTLEKSYVSKQATRIVAHTYSVCKPIVESSIIQLKSSCSCSNNKNISAEKKEKIKKNSKPTKLVDENNHIHRAESRSNDKNIGAEKKEKVKKSSKVIIFVDGDNHIHTAEKGIEHTSKNISVRVFFSQPGAQKKFDKKYAVRSNIVSKLVKSGKQAVDNRIKAEAGQILKRDKEQKIIIVSEDRGFEKFAKKFNNNRIFTAKSVQEGLNKG